MLPGSPGIATSWLHSTGLVVCSCQYLLNILAASRLSHRTSRLVDAGMPEGKQAAAYRTSHVKGLFS